MAVTQMAVHRDPTMTHLPGLQKVPEVKGIKVESDFDTEVM